MSGISSSISTPGVFTPGIYTPGIDTPASIYAESEEESAQKQGYAPILHALDLPNLQTFPEPKVLLNTLSLYGRRGEVVNFSNEQDVQESAPQGLFTWLTKLVASPLDWISDEQIREEIWSQASSSMAERCGRTAAPGFQRTIRIPLNGEDESDLEIELHEPSLISDSLGLKTWGSSYILSKRLAAHPEILKSPVLELGAGTGLCSIVAARMGKRVVSTDLAEIVPNLRHNIDLNLQAKDSIETSVLDWSDPKDFKGSFKSIILSDPVYSSAHPPMILNMIHRYLERSSDSSVCIQLPLREKFEMERALLWDLLKAGGLEKLQGEEEEGFDDFGQQSFAWSLWGWKGERVH